ncbi:GspH/FimT family pseudopilin [Marinobacter zhejiangensis]|uniref:Type II secretion system protein H n=1 Tax=Marinobacter zhejiangensis TaxID=488535 RepID=A0A1I4S8C6_9GAMM|nr:GspH/FimT family pseudopilin [Marinobacter zhejiangensis]SFM60513.1 type IV fimbrial biogenesis protein FimT [Marinobacter zhejiangensis]
MLTVKKNAGFTVIELLTALFVLAVAVSLAVPSFRQMIQNNRMASQINLVTSLVSFARSEAAKRPNVVITTCPSADLATCAASANWEQGWVIFVDIDGDRVVDAGDGDAVLYTAGPISGGNTLRVSGLTNTNYVQFFGNGEPVPPSLGAGASGTFTLCDSRGAEVSRNVVVMESGQTRLARDTNGDGIPNNHAGNNVSCP